VGLRRGIQARGRGAGVGLLGIALSSTVGLRHDVDDRAVQIADRLGIALSSTVGLRHLQVRGVVAHHVPLGIALSSTVGLRLVDLAADRVVLTQTAWNRLSSTAGWLPRRSSTRKIIRINPPQLRERGHPCRPPAQAPPSVGRQPSRPHKLRPGRGRRAPPKFADANAPLSCESSWLRRSSSRTHRTRPELLRRRSRHGQPRARPSSQPR
jgi:hypothetical protein